MSMSDPIADMMTRVRNAQLSRKLEVSMPSSKTKVAIAQVLKAEGYISSFQIIEENKKALLNINLKYHQGKPVIDLFCRVSRPGLRVYNSCKKMPIVMGGLGIAIVSTSKGIMQSNKARLSGLGGEIIGFVA